MSDFDDLMRLAGEVTSRWSHKTLADLRAEAEKEINGTVFESFRASNVEQGLSPRFGLVVCVTGEHELSRVEKIFNFVDDGASGDWNAYSLASMWVDSYQTDGMGYQDLYRDGKLVAVALCASHPQTIATLERVFGMN